MAAGLSSVGYPTRIVCTTTESVDILYRLGLGDRVVGVSGFTTEPKEARRKPKIGTYTSVNLEAVRALRPDLVVAFSDLQAQIAHDLIREGFTVFALNQRTLRGTLEAILMLGSLVGAPGAAERLVTEMQAQMEAARARSQTLLYHPRVYFEEWHDPLISGIGWVGELVEIAGGIDLFPDLKGHGGSERIVSPDEVVRRDPDLILASWCGKKVDVPGILSREGWESVSAIQHRRVYEVKSAHVLEPGPSLLKGLEEIQEIIRRDFGRHDFGRHQERP